MTIRVDLVGDGTGTVTFPDHQVPIAATGPVTARDAAVQELVTTAQRAGQAVMALTSEPAGTQAITVHPDGTIEPTEMPADTAQEDRAQMPAEAAPQPGPDQPAAPASAAPHVQTAEHESVPVETSASPNEPQQQAFSFENDPDWQAEAGKPATTGLKGWLNTTLHMTWPAKGEELDERRQAFIERKNAEWYAESQRQQEQARREQAARQQAEADERQRFQQQERQRQENERRAALETERRLRIEALNANIQTNFQRTMTILVANPKGGARKTTTTYMLGATIGAIRGGSTVAWDANETMGTLGERAKKDRHSRTVVDLLQDGAQHFLNIDSARVGILDAYVRNQGNAHFDVLASDENPGRQEIIDADGFAKVHDILSHFYRMILVDTGNNIRADHFVAAQQAANQLVIPVAASHDSKNRALDMMSAFSSSGYDHLVANAVVLVHELEPIERDAQGTVISQNGHEMTAQAIADAFAGRVGAVLPVPYDAALKDGGEIDVDALTSATGDAYRIAADAIATSLLAQEPDTDRAAH